eukprot:GHVL01015988.1.p1 GENE.GHVL01015988.1~~GHVL01015988.1.p1  ORF type:complete len:1389 (-),score=306.81 GHVL01015988.1:87-4253(-)
MESSNSQKFQVFSEIPPPGHFSSLYESDIPKKDSRETILDGRHSANTSRLKDDTIIDSYVLPVSKNSSLVTLESKKKICGSRSFDSCGVSSDEGDIHGPKTDPTFWTDSMFSSRDSKTGALFKKIKKASFTSSVHESDSEDAITRRSIRGHRVSWDEQMLNGRSKNGIDDLKKKHYTINCEKRTIDHIPELKKNNENLSVGPSNRSMSLISFGDGISDGLVSENVTKNSEDELPILDTSNRACELFTKKISMKKDIEHVLELEVMELEKEKELRIMEKEMKKKSLELEIEREKQEELKKNLEDEKRKFDIQKKKKDDEIEEKKKQMREELEEEHRIRMDKLKNERENEIREEKKRIEAIERERKEEIDDVRQKLEFFSRMKDKDIEESRQRLELEAREREIAVENEKKKLELLTIEKEQEMEYKYKKMEQEVKHKAEEIEDERRRLSIEKQLFKSKLSLGDAQLPQREISDNQSIRHDDHLYQNNMDSKRTMIVSTNYPEHTDTSVYRQSLSPPRYSNSVVEKNSVILAPGENQKKIVMQQLPPSFDAANNLNMNVHHNVSHHSSDNRDAHQTSRTHQSVDNRDMVSHQSGGPFNNTTNREIELHQTGRSHHSIDNRDMVSLQNSYGNTDNRDMVSQQNYNNNNIRDMVSQQNYHNNNNRDMVSQQNYNNRDMVSKQNYHNNNNRDMVSQQNYNNRDMVSQQNSYNNTNNREMVSSRNGRSCNNIGTREMVSQQNGRSYNRRHMDVNRHGMSMPAAHQYHYDDGRTNDMYKNPERQCKSTVVSPNRYHSSVKFRDPAPVERMDSERSHTSNATKALDYIDQLNGDLEQPHLAIWVSSVDNIFDTAEIRVECYWTSEPLKEGCPVSHPAYGSSVVFNPNNGIIMIPWQNNKHGNVEITPLLALRLLDFHDNVISEVVVNAGDWLLYDSESCKEDRKCVSLLLCKNGRRTGATMTIYPRWLGDPYILSQLRDYQSKARLLNVEFIGAQNLPKNLHGYVFMEVNVRLIHVTSTQEGLRKVETRTVTSQSPNWHTGQGPDGETILNVTESLMSIPIRPGLPVTRDTKVSVRLCYKKSSSSHHSSVKVLGQISSTIGRLLSKKNSNFHPIWCEMISHMNPPIICLKWDFDGDLDTGIPSTPEYANNTFVRTKLDFTPIETVQTRMRSHSIEELNAPLNMVDLDQTIPFHRTSSSAQSSDQVYLNNKNYNNGRHSGYQQYLEVPQSKGPNNSQRLHDDHITQGSARQNIQQKYQSISPPAHDQYQSVSPSLQNCRSVSTNHNRSEQNRQYDEYQEDPSEELYQASKPFRTNSNQGQLQKMSLRNIPQSSSADNINHYQTWNDLHDHHSSSASFESEDFWSNHLSDAKSFKSATMLPLNPFQNSKNPILIKHPPM